MFYTLVKNGRSIDALTTDSCSAYLCRYYRRVGNTKKLNKILRRNFIQYDGAYYSFNINNGIAVRMMTIEEGPTCDCAFEFAADDELISKLQEKKFLSIHERTEAYYDNKQNQQQLCHRSDNRLC